MQEYGAIDVLVLNAVVNPTFGPLLDAPAEAISKILDVNIKAALLLVAEAHPLLAPKVCNINSSIIILSCLHSHECWHTHK
jgi:NAD(P)-dependent dehydrogenase (short-subunit alcohol dehydrogenase family)